jgi:small subunit ribosomal protein S20
LPNTQSAAKQMRSSERKRIRNRGFRSATRTAVKKARLHLESGDLEAATAATQEAISALDRAASKGVIHRNAAARSKSRLMKRLAALQESS